MSISKTHRMGPIRLATILSFLLSWIGVAGGVENVRNVGWTYEPTIAWSPAESSVRLTFDADLTQVEIMYPITSFAIALVYPEGSPVILTRYSCGPLAPGTPAGTTTRIDLELSLQCDPLRGNIEVKSNAASMRSVHPTIGETNTGIQALQRTAYGSVRQSLGIAILDQDGNVVSQSLPRGTFVCDPDDPATQPNGSLGVYFDAQGTICQGTIPAGTVGKVYVFATLEGATAGGLAGAEFRFSGIPTAWEAYAVPSPDLLAIGDPFADGVVAGFPCKQSSNGKVLLYTVAVIAHQEVSDVRFDVNLRTPPLSLPCPLVLACDEPAFTKYCVETSSCYINATQSTPCSAPVAVSQVTWSQVKEFYR